MSGAGPSTAVHLCEQDTNYDDHGWTRLPPGISNKQEAIHPRDRPTHNRSNTCTGMSVAALFTEARKWKRPRQVHSVEYYS